MKTLMPGLYVIKGTYPLRNNVYIQGLKVTIKQGIKVTTMFGESLEYAYEELPATDEMIDYVMRSFDYFMSTN